MKPVSPRRRQVEPADRVRGMLIEALHAAQDECHCLSPGHLAAVAREFRLSPAEVYETATFYHHFDVLADGDAPPRRSRFTSATRSPANWRARPRFLKISAHAAEATSAFCRRPAWPP